MKRMQASWLVGLVCVVIGLGSTPVWAAGNTERTNSVGVWSDAYWSSGKPAPAGADRAFIGNTYQNWGGDEAMPGNTPQAEVTLDENTAEIWVLWVGSGDPARGAATGTVNLADFNVLARYGEAFGYGAAGSRGILNQTGTGDNTVEGGLGGGVTLGGNTGTYGEYNLDNIDAALTIQVEASGYTGADGALNVGVDGVGVFNHSNGTVDVQYQHAGIWYGNVNLGKNSGGTGTYKLVNGTLTSHEVRVGYEGNGTFNQLGGTCTAYNGVRIGHEAGSTGSYTCAGGILTNPWDGLRVGMSGRGTMTISGDASVSVTYNMFVAESAGGYGRVTQSGGTLSVDQVLDIGGASAGAAGAVGEYNLGGGTCNVDNATNVGLGGTGTVNQTGGRYNSMIDAGQGNYLNIGSENGRGTYNLTGGTLGIDRYNLIPVGIRLGTAANGHGEFKLGDETSCGSIVEIGNGAWFPIDFYVRIATNSTGVFRGWSDDGGGNTLQIYGDFCNNGQVIADGYGQERSLDLSNMAEARTGTNGWAFAISDDNLLDNTTSNGWFAVNKGKLIFPGVAVSAATTYNWGERQGDSTIDAVNSARIKFNAFAGSGDLDGSLLAVDRSDVPAGPVSLISVHDLSLSGGASSDDFNLTIRYDDAAAGTEEADLKLFHYTGGKWVDTAATLDTGNKWITASNLTSFSEFGVGFEFAAGTMFKIR